MDPKKYTVLRTFRAQAWRLANDTALRLGWFAKPKVGDRGVEAIKHIQNLRGNELLWVYAILVLIVASASILVLVIGQLTLIG